MAFGFHKKMCLAVSSLKKQLVLLKKKRGEIRCGGITAWKSVLQFCFPVESLHLHEVFESLLVVSVFAYTITDCLYCHFMLMC